jgi:hypothetical protein
MIEGFDYQQQKEFVSRNLNVEATPKLMEKIQEEIDLCSTPLNLCIFSLLHEEGSLEDIHTRTELYQELVHFLTQKASFRMNITEEEIRKTLLVHLFKMACECLRSGNVAFKDSSEKAEKLCAAGFITREVITSRLRPKKRYSFMHRTLLEFMAASHVTNMEEQERVKWMESLDVEKDKSLIRFIFGISQSNENIIKSTAEIFLHVACLHYRDMHSPTHMYMTLICEMETAVPMCEQIITATHPEQFYFHNICSQECFHAAKILLNLSFKINVVFWGKITDSIKDLMRRLRNARSVHEVTLKVDKDTDSLNE